MDELIPSETKNEIVKATRVLGSGALAGGAVAFFAGLAVTPVAVAGGVLAGISWLIKKGIDKSKEE